MCYLQEMHPNLLKPFIDKSGVVILDGAMATELEKKGADLNHPLWSARLLREKPSLIRQVHLDYLKSGADIITTASYQASFPGFEKQGYTKPEAIDLLNLSTRLALEARTEARERGYSGIPEPLIAASIGPYGAYLADGSEYRGDYHVHVEDLMDFHRERLKILAESGADLFACETIPCPEEAIALVNLLKEFPGTSAWISFSCKNDSMVCSGAAFADCIELVNDSEQVLAVGVNCTAPQYVESLVKIAGAVTEKYILAYPNKGETWDAKYKKWLPGEGSPDFESCALIWKKAGASLIGGCCRTTPEDIRKMRNGFFRD
jgi:homocysteine S-methyltransferase